MSKELKTSHGEPEVFVLPPNLLEKLGINLSNITQNAQQLQERKKKKKNKHNLKNGSYSNHDGIKSNVSEAQKKNEESSILETADLMKKSVFLSPTFIPMVVNAIPGEVEIVNNVGSAVNFFDSAEINTGIIASDNNFNKDIDEKNVEREKLPCTLLDSKQCETSKKIDISNLCNGNGLGPKIKKKENVLTNGIQINNFNSDRTDSISTKENQLTSLQHKQANSQISKILCDSYANSDNMSCEISTDNIIQDLSLLIKSNKDNNIIPDVVIDTVISNKKYFLNNKSTIGIDEALIIPLSMTPEPTSYINMNDINEDAEDMNIDVFQTLNEQESDELKMANNKQKHEICKSAEVVQSNDVNIDIIKYTECDDCSDMELENMLHETEILVPTTSTTEETKSSRNAVINIIDKEVYRTNSQRDVTDENDLCNSIEENKILISILPELIDTSSLDIFCEHNITDDIEMNNVNKYEKLPISDDSDSVEYIQSNQINIDTITNIEHIKTRNKSDIELDNVLRETEILIPLLLPSESINNNNKKNCDIFEIENKSTCNEYEVLNEKEAEKEFIEGEVPLIISTTADVREKDEKDQISENTMVVDNSATMRTDNSLEYEDTSKIQDVNNETMKSEQKNLLHIVSLDHVTQSIYAKSLENVSNNSCTELNLTSFISDTEIKIIDNENKTVIKTLEQNIQNHNNDSSTSESKDVHLVLKNKHRCDSIQMMQTVQSNYVYFDTKGDRKYEINKSKKPEFTKSEKDKSNDTLSIHKQIETNKFQDKVILRDQHKICNQLNIKPNDSLQNNHVDNIKEDKVQEIAEYLKQVIQNKNKRKFNRKRAVKILKPKPGSLTKSKIFIQGVEKPGGSEEYEIHFDTKKIHRAYERKEKHVQSQLTPIIGTVLLKDVTRPEENYSEVNTCIEQSLSPKRQEYCLCGDFGKFTFYDDYDNLYEHIHFGSNKSVNCPIDTVFEIYNDERNTIVNNIEERECTQDKNYSSENEDCHICWQKFEYHQYKFFRPEMQSNNLNECIDDTNLNTDVSLTKSNSPLIQKELETAKISELETSKNDSDICDNNITSSKVSNMLLTAVIVEDNYEITSSLSSNTSTPASHIHWESKKKEDNNQPKSCRTINESVEIEIDEGSQIDIESTDKEDSIQQYSCDNIDKTVAFEEDEILHIDVSPKEKEDNTVQQSCQIIDESVEDAAHKASHVDIQCKEKEDNKGEQSCEAVDESVVMAPDVVIRENIINETMDFNRDCVQDVQKSRNHLKSRKRKIKRNSEEAPSKKSDKCGVCQQVFAPSEWEDHISTVHCYIAWKDGQTLDFDNLLLLKKLKKKLKNDSNLKCSFCAFKNTNLEKFLSHVKKCVAEVSKSKIDKSKEPKEVSFSSKSGKSKCGVCHVDVDDANWIGHISDEHHYLAWKDGEPPLDTSDENKVKTHLLNLVKIYGQLICTKCGLLRRYTPKTIKSYLTHIKTCRNNNPTESRRSNIKTEPSTKSDAPSTSAYKCAVCSEKVDASKWIDHIAQEHNYRAWKDGDVAPNLEDKDVLWEHLNEISKQAGGLHCSKCGVVRKYVKPFLQHIGFCTGNEEVDESNSDNNKQTIEHNTLESPKTNTQIDAPISTSTPKTSRKKAKISQKTSCGVCLETVEDWIDHIGKEHNYLAWKDGESPLDVNDREAVWQHLHNVVSIAGKLVCAKCGKFRKYPKMYLQHVSECRGPVTSVVDDSLKESKYSVLSHLDRSLTGQNLNSGAKVVKCGVCQEVVGRNAWIAHIQTAHSYVAWVDGETPLDSKNEETIRHHLQQIVDEVGTLVCPTCGSSRKYAKKFLQHVKQCTAKKKTGKNKVSISQNIPPHELVECGACKQTVQINQWVNHMRTMHNYLAWKQGNLSIRSTALAKKRLDTLREKLGVLNCPKCGYKGNVVDLYLQHAESCKGNIDIETEDDEVTKLAREGLYQCALCSENIKYGDWREHSLSKHYTVAWVVGDEPIDVFNQNEIAKIMKEYQQYGEYVCKVCGISRSSGLGFFAHVISCGLKEEEADRFKITCEVCNAKCPGIYKSQHMAAHTQQVMAKQRKVVAQEDREKEKQRKLDELTPTPGRRRAAEKARMVIEETVSQFKHVCQSCAFATDAEEDMAKHKCLKKRKMSDDLDLSLEQAESSEEEALPDLENASDEGEEDSKSDPKKRPDNSGCTAKITRIPFVVSNVQDYVTKNLEDYTKTYLTTSTLFPEWSKCGCEAVTGDELCDFMPPLEESCQVHASGSWRNYKRWEAVVEKQKTTVFTGASIQRVRWLPAPASSEEPASHVLAVACHSGVDCPQYHVDDLPEHKALIQFWDFGDFKTTPKLVFGLALQHGTVWGMDWCPSGAREAPPKDSDKGFVRMGLLAVACSNGMAYIYSVPYPSSVVVSDSIIHKLEPVAQLKFTMKSDRKVYQATSICWSQQKGHGTVIVGYGDGSTAYYDLNTESPFLKSQENNVTIFYPFYDEHTHNGSITDMDSFPMARASSVAGAVCVSSPTGSVLSSHGGAARCARARSHLASSTATFLPAWPSALLAGEDIVTNITPAELEYWGMGRRVGFLSTCCGCPHCALVAAFMAPFLRLMRPHHARSDLKKQVIAWIGAKQLATKRKHNEDKAANKMEEALTYEEVVAKYGIQFRLVNKEHNKDDMKKAMSQYKEVNPECFPIAEVPSMAFCPSAKHHRRLAVATHAGLIFVLNA